jgi:hypothetical protein
MPVQYDGQSPSRLWKVWQKTKAFAKSPFEPSVARSARAAGRNGAYTAGTGLGWSLAHTYVLGSIPLATTLLGWVIAIPAVIGLGVFGYKTYKNLKDVNRSSFMSSYVRKQQDKWLDRKKNGNAVKQGIKSVRDRLSRLVRPFTHPGESLPLPLVKAGKFLGYAAAAAGLALSAAAGLSYAGVPAFSTGATAATVLGGVAHVGALVGLTATAAVATATGLAIAAIPLGIAAAFWCRKTAYARDDVHSVFSRSFKSLKSDDAPDTGSPAPAPKPAANTFNAAAPAATTPAADSSLDADRQKAAAKRAADRQRRTGGNRFG